MPNVNKLNGSICMGTAGVPGSIDGNLISDFTKPLWLINEWIVFQQPSDNRLWYFNTITGHRELASNFGANELKANNGVWAAWLDGIGLFSSIGFNEPNAGLLAVGPDASIGYVPIRNIGVGALVKEYGGQIWTLTNQIVSELQLLGDKQAIWTDENFNIFTKNLPPCVQVGPARQLQAFFIDNQWWVSYWTEAAGVVLHPFNSTIGYTIVPANFPAFGVCIFIMPDGVTVRPNWSIREGELPQDLAPPLGNPLYINTRTAPRHELKASSPILPIGRKMWFGWFEFAYNTGNVWADANCYLSVTENGVIFDNRDWRDFAQFVTGLSVEEIERQANATSLPVVAYWDGRNWPRRPNLKRNDYLAIQAYRRANETEQQFEDDIARVIFDMQPYRIALICQCYTSNVQLTKDLASLPPIYSRLARRFSVSIEMMLVFSDQGRATGLNDHPEVRPLWAQVFNGITGAPELAEQPKVTIVSYEPKEGNAPLKVRAVAELSGGQADTLTWKLDGQTVVTNPAFDLDHTYNITAPGTHRINVRVDGPGGSDETAKVREVIVHQSEPPQPPETGKRAYLRLNNKYVYVKDEIVSYGSEEDVIELGDDFVKINGKYVATTPSGILEANRDTKGIWELHEIKYASDGEQVAIYSREWNKWWRVQGNRIIADSVAEVYFDVEKIQFDSSIKLAGKFFTREDGTPITIIQSSEFSLYKYWLDGQNIDPILSERQEIGFNCLRVWLLNESVIPGGLHPDDYLSFYDELAPFARKCADFGFIVEFTVFTSTKIMMPDHGDQVDHLNRVVGALRDESNILLELVNENDQHDNAVWEGLNRPIFGISSHGSNGADHIGVEPFWDYSQYHTNDLNEWQRKVGHNAMELANGGGCPVVSNENMRCPDRDSNPIHFFDAAAGASLLCAGACFHSQGGKFSRPFDDTEKTCAIEWVKGANSVPLKFQHGEYHRRDDLLEPGIIRVYEKRLPDDSYILRIRE